VARLKGRGFLMHEIQVNVRFSETDALGHINNASYFVYLEEQGFAL